jgi:cyanophycinase-like exopeptidase
MSQRQTPLSRTTKPLAWVRKSKWAGAAALALLACGAVSAQKTTKPTYSYTFIGNPDAVSTAAANRAKTPSVVIMGGGPDVDQAFSWMIQRAGVVPGSGGRFVVIRATGTGAYNDYIYENDASKTLWPTVVGGKGLGLSSVETLVIPDIASANHAFVNQIVGRADAVFIAGGDQRNYIKQWKGTLLNNTLNTLIGNKVPVGGTSAGLAVLGQFDFAAINGTVTSAQALSDPYNKYMTLDPNPQTYSISSTSNPGGFLVPNVLLRTLADAHLDERDRMGRLVAFTARLVGPDGAGGGCAGGIQTVQTPGVPLSPTLNDSVARSLGVGVESAVLIEGDGVQAPVVGKVVTNPDTTTLSAAYFLMATQAPTQCASRKPLSGMKAQAVRVRPEQTFNLSTWAGVGIDPPYTLSVDNGVLSSSTGGSVY